MVSRGKRVAIYLRVSTSEQSTDNQRRELQAVAKRHEWRVVEAFEDAGISGAKGRELRPGLDALLKALLGGKWTWSPRGRSIGWAGR